MASQRDASYLGESRCRLIHDFFAREEKWDAHTMHLLSWPFVLAELQRVPSAPLPPLYRSLGLPAQFNFQVSHAPVIILQVHD